LQLNLVAACVFSCIGPLVAKQRDAFVFGYTGALHG
jgi:hypothetical protein